MKFGTKLKLKKDWSYDVFDFEKGDILQVVFYEHKYSLQLQYPRIIGLIFFNFEYNTMDKRIDEYFEVLEDNELSTDDKEFIKNLSNEMNTQDTRCTAQPYALVVQQQNTRIVPEGYSDLISCYWEESEYDDWDDFISEIKEFYCYGTPDLDLDKHKGIETIIQMTGFSELKDSYEATEIEATVHYIKKEQEFKEHGINFFFTEKAYSQHIKENGHNLGCNPTSYGIHLHRNKEMEQLIEIVHKLAKGLQDD